MYVPVFCCVLISMWTTNGIQISCNLQIQAIHSRYVQVMMSISWLCLCLLYVITQITVGLSQFVFLNWHSVYCQLSASQPVLVENWCTLLTINVEVFQLGRNNVCSLNSIYLLQDISMDSCLERWRSLALSCLIIEAGHHLLGDDANRTEFHFRVVAFCKFFFVAIWPS